MRLVMASNTQQLAEIAQLLLEITKEHALAWSADSLREDAFTAVLGDATVKLSPGVGSFIDVDVHNKEGVAVEEYSGHRAPDDVKRMLLEVYDLARRQALRTDEIVASVIGELKKRSPKR
jgi:hypothetical protein